MGKNRQQSGINRLCKEYLEIYEPMKPIVEVKRMFMWSFRFSPFKVLVSVLVVALIGVLSVTGIKVFTQKDTVEAVAPETVSQPAKPPKLTGKTNKQRLEFIRSFGWEVQEEPVEVMEVIIPQEFDAVYEEYNAVQKKQGFDLSKHAGKRVKRYSYVVTNYPGVEGEVRVNLLVKDNKIIGGDVCSMEMDGFMHGFSKV